MKKITMKPLSTEAFLAYGRYASLTEPSGVALGLPPIRFFRDLLPLGSAQNLAASVTETAPIDLTVSIMEFHTNTWEAFMTLDTESCICVGPATGEAVVNPDALEAFRVPPCTMIYLHPGVWHYAPYPLEGKTLHSLVLLPERTYANDCVKVSLDAADAVTIEG